MRFSVVVLFAACVCLAASHSITRDLLGPNPDLFSELENVRIDTPAGDVPYKNCGAASDLMTISSINLTPFPAKKGQSVSTVIQGTLNKGFNTGHWSVTVQSGIVKKTVTGDICADLKQQGKSCPVASGPVNFNHVQSIPSIAPSGTYHVTSVSTGDTGQLFCIQFDMPIQDELDASPICRKCVEKVSEVIMSHTVHDIIDKCRHATDPATKAKCEIMRAHQNFTLGMLVEEVQPLKDAALYCMGGHYCRAADLELDTGDSIETELAELGAMLQDVISEPPATAIFTSGAEDCGSCVDAGDKAVMQDVIAKVKNFCAKTKDPKEQQRCAWAAAHPEFTVGFLFAKVNPSEFSDGECVEQKLCPDPYTAAASRSGIDVATSVTF